MNDFKIMKCSGIIGNIETFSILKAKKK